MLNASNRQEADSWSKRQLGERSPRFFVFEMDAEGTKEWIERTGTGISPTEVAGCFPRLSVMADSWQRLSGSGPEVLVSSEWARTTEIRSRVASVH